LNRIRLRDILSTIINFIPEVYNLFILYLIGDEII
jgi:hypothetical protein